MQLTRLFVERDSLGSQIVRSFIGERTFDDISATALSGMGVPGATNWLWDATKKFGGWLLQQSLGFFQWSATGILQFLFRQGVKAFNFDVMQTYDDINKEIESNNLTLTNQLGTLAGSGLVWTGMIALAGKQSVRFPVLASRVGLALAEEGGQTLRTQLSSFLENTAENTLDNLLMFSWSGYRMVGEVINLASGGIPMNWSERDPLSLSSGIEWVLNKIPGGKWVSTFVRGLVDGAYDAFLDAAYCVTFTIDDHFLATQAAVDARQENFEPVRTLEVFPDRDSEESIIIEDTQSNVELTLNNYLSTHSLVDNRDIGTVVGQPYEEWYTQVPQSRKLLIEFRGNEKPPFLTSSGDLSKRVQVAIPNAKATIDWSDLKQLKKFTWGNYMARGIFEDRRQMTVWGSTPGEAKDTLLALAKLSQQKIAQVSVSHPEIQNPRRIKRPTLVYPCFATMLVRKATLGANDYALIDGQNKAMSRTRLEIWRDEKPDDFKGFI